MEKIIIEGKSRLEGYVNINGMKNSALPVIFATILVKGECIIENMPRVSDVFDSLEILRSMGAVAEFCDLHTVRINTDNIQPTGMAYNLICKMRASSYLLGTMLSRFGKVEIPFPGGCNFGARPLDLHLRGFEMMGALCEESRELIKIYTPKRLKCSKIILDKISVGATINMILALAKADGISIIENCATEPHVDDLICFLNNCGANVFRHGTTIMCVGCDILNGTKYSIYPDMIEALTYMIFVGICRGRIKLLGVLPEHLKYCITIFEKMGYELTILSNEIIVSANNLCSVNVVTAPYPAFPTDLHPQFTALLCYSNGTGSVKDTVFPNRFAYVRELIKMGASIVHTDDTVFIKKSSLHGATLDATDLRAGAALVAAALGAEGKSQINNVNYIVRGYENIVDKIANIGGKIKLLKGE